MICSSLYRLFFMPCPPVQFTRELQFSLVEFFGGTSPALFATKLLPKPSGSRWLSRGGLSLFFASERCEPEGQEFRLMRHAGSSPRAESGWFAKVQPGVLIATNTHTDASFLQSTCTRH
jgi:hypothetical protein